MGVLTNYIRASYSLIYMVTPEEARAEMEIYNTAKELKRKLMFWSTTEGFYNPADDYREEEQDPVEALIRCKSESEKTMIVMRDLHSFFQSPIVIRMLRDIARDFKQQSKTLIILTPVNRLPLELERDAVLIDFALPGREEITTVFDSLYKANKKGIGQIDENERDRIIQASLGLTTNEAESAFAKAIVERAQVKDGPKPNISDLVMKEKAAAVKKSGILEYTDSPITASDIGGLDNLKLWFNIRGKAFTKKAREFGLPMPRGILLVGLPGCGKSLSAKAASNVLNIPLIRFDIGRVFGGLVGESEQNMRLAIQTIEAIGACVVWIDEMEKAFAGMQSSGSTDSGVTARVFGNFITWMQEKKTPSFIIATVNRIEGLPPEMLRKGRFDEIFFVGLPSKKERGEILNIHTRKYKRDPDKFNFKKAVDDSNGFSGAELEEAIVTGLYQAFYEEGDLKVEYVEKAIRETTPLSESQKPVLRVMSEWAEKNAVNASMISSDDKDGKNGKHAGRQLEVG